MAGVSAAGWVCYYATKEVNVPAAPHLGRYIPSLICKKIGAKYPYLKLVDGGLFITCPEKFKPYPPKVDTKGHNFVYWNLPKEEIGDRCD